MRRIAQILAMGPETERKYRKALESAGALAGEAAALPELAELRAIVEAAHPRRHPPQERSTAEPYRVEIEAMVRLGAEPRAIYDKLRLDEPDLDVSYHAIKRLCRRLRKARPVREGDVALHVVLTLERSGQGRLRRCPCSLCVPCFCVLVLRISGKNVASSLRSELTNFVLTETSHLR